MTVDKMDNKNIDKGDENLIKLPDKKYWFIIWPVHSTAFTVLVHVNFQNFML